MRLKRRSGVCILATCSKPLLLLYIILVIFIARFFCESFAANSLYKSLTREL